MPKWQWVYTCRGEAYIAFMQTQLEMTRSAVTALEQADRNLNTTYKQLQGKLDKQSRAKLLTAQRTWLAYRDADALLTGDIDARGGSMQGVLVAVRKGERTISRQADCKRINETNGRRWSDPRPYQARSIINRRRYRHE